MVNIKSKAANILGAKPHFKHFNLRNFVLSKTSVTGSGLIVIRGLFTNGGKHVESGCYYRS